MTIISNSPTILGSAQLTSAPLKAPFPFVFTGVGYLYNKESVSDTIRRFPLVYASPTLSISWTPTNPYVFNVSPAEELTYDVEAFQVGSTSITLSDLKFIQPGTILVFDTGESHVVSGSWNLQNPVLLVNPVTTSPQTASFAFPSSFTANQTPIGTPITFTAQAIFNNTNSYPVLYTWDFGDDATGYGLTATHTYTLPNPFARVVFTATDNLGKEWAIGRPLYLSGLAIATVGLPFSLITS